MDAVICVKCGRQVEEIKELLQPNIVINNDNSSRNTNTSAAYNGNQYRYPANPKNKFTALLLCFS